MRLTKKVVDGNIELRGYYKYYQVLGDGSLSLSREYKDIICYKE